MGAATQAISLIFYSAGDLHEWAGCVHERSDKRSAPAFQSRLTIYLHGRCRRGLNLGASLATSVALDLRRDSMRVAHGADDP